jgi:hypothetical protein
MGDLGTGTKGDWVHGKYDTKRRWCFGMDETGGYFGCEKMKRDPKTGLAKMPPGFENNWPYGMSFLGHLVRYNKRQPIYDSAAFSDANEAEERTAIGWSPRGDFFLVATHCANWYDLTAFFGEEDDPSFDDPPSGDPPNILGGLRKHIIANYKGYDILYICDALTLDGGSKTEIEYRQVGAMGNILGQSGPNAPRAEDSHPLHANIVGAEVEQKP